jgi:hypothetical protein
MIANKSVPEWNMEMSEDWVSAKLEPRAGHSLDEIERMLAPFAYELRVLDSDLLAYEGKEEPLHSVEGIAFVYVLPHQGFVSGSF